MLQSEIEGGKFVGGVWLPVQEKHLVEWMLRGKRAYTHKGRQTYQWSKQQAAAEVAQAGGFNLRAMVDVGAHCALWSMWWASWVPHIVAYEPVPLHQRLYRANMALEGHCNYELVPYALGDRPGQIDLRLDPENTGHTRAYGPNEKRIETVNVPVVTLDSDVPDRLGEHGLGFLKVDCEGYEEKVLRGAKDTLTRHRPMVIVEQKQEHLLGHTPRGAVLYLKGLGYKVVRELSGDFIMVPE